jgi:hypothetical protein
MATEVILDDAEVKHFLENIIKKSREMNKQPEIVGAISAIVFQDIIDHFSKQEGPGGKWPEWSKGHKKRANKAGYNEASNMLKWTGKLRNNTSKNKARVLTDGIQWFNNAKTSARTVDDNKEDIVLQRMRAREKELSVKKKTKRFGKTVSKLAGKIAKRTVKIEKRKKTKKGGGFPYAWFHDSGAPIKFRRSFMWISEASMNKIVDVVLNKILEDTY